jgi:hypothetical protein
MSRQPHPRRQPQPGDRLVRRERLGRVVEYYQPPPVSCEPTVDSALALVVSLLEGEALEADCDTWRLDCRRNAQVLRQLRAELAA